MDEFNVRFVPDTEFVRVLHPLDENGLVREGQRIELRVGGDPWRYCVDGRVEVRIGEPPGPYGWMAAEARTVSNDKDFDREVSRIGRERAIAFFLPRFALIAAIVAVCSLSLIASN